MLTTLIVLLGGALSGFFNTVASSGSAISLPLLMYVGLSPVMANGTNRVGLLFSSIAAILAFQKAKAIDWRGAGIILIPVLLGTAAGSVIATFFNAKSMGAAVVVAVVMAFVMIVSNPKRLLRDNDGITPRVLWKHHILFFLAGVWAGFIVLDSATYILLALVLGARYDLIRANAIKSVVLLGVSLTSLAVFAGKAEIDWGLGAIMAAGSAFGAWFGGRLATNPNAKVWVVRLLMIIIVGEIIHLSLRYF